MTVDTAISLCTFAASLVAAILSFMAIIAGSYSKIAEFRKDWNDKLRDDLANFLAELMNSLETNSHTKLAYYSARIDLSLDINKSSHRKLFELKEEIMRTVTGLKDLRSNLFEEFKAAAQVLLDGEWNRLKQEIVHGWKFWKSIKT
jgi:hypothetical protein